MVRIAILGAGSMGWVHSGHLSKLDGVQITAVCDMDESKAQNMAKQYSARAFTKWEDMLAAGAIDALYSSLPPRFHDEPILAAVEQGIHVFVEKPVTLDREAGWKIAKNISQKGLVSACGYHMRYLDTTERLREIISAHGKIPLVYAKVLIGHHGRAGSWWAKESLSGGVVAYAMGHLIDLARYLFGEIEMVTAASNRSVIKADDEYDLEDANVLLAKFDNGVIGSFITSPLSGVKSTFHLWVVGFDLLAEISHLDNSLKVTTPKEMTETTPKVNPYFEENRVFIEAIKKADPSLLKGTYEDGLKTAEVVIAAHRAAERARWEKVENLTAEAQRTQRKK